MVIRLPLNHAVWRALTGCALFHSPILLRSLRPARLCSTCALDKSLRLRRSFLCRFRSVPFPRAVITSRMTGLDEHRRVPPLSSGCYRHCRLSTLQAGMRRDGHLILGSEALHHEAVQRRIKRDLDACFCQQGSHG